MPETQSHYLQCTATSRTAWRISLLTTLRRQLTALKTDSNLQEAILNCIDCALAERQVTTLGSFHVALEAQAKIGWTAMLRGYWANKWQLEYERTYPIPDEETHKNKNKRHQQMTRWQKKVIQTTWTALIQLWTLRNKERHGWDKESRDSAQREVLHKELADIYDKRDKYPQRVQRVQCSIKTGLGGAGVCIVRARCA